MSKTKTIFIVDDDEAVRDSLGVMLRTDGYAVKTFGSCQSFLDNFKQTQSACLLLDLHLPDMDGWELLDVLRERNIEIPVILITGRNSPDYQARATAAGTVALFGKPLNHDALLDAIDTAIQ